MKIRVLPYDSSAYIIGLASALVLSTAYIFEYFANLQPCILCLYQRLPYAAAITIMVLAVFLKKHPRLMPFLFGITAILFFISSGLAVFHVGVEQHFWQGTSECGNFISADNVESLRKKLLAQPLIRCDEIAWSLFGLSMAGYNFLISAALLLYSIGVLHLQQQQGVRIDDKKQ